MLCHWAIEACCGYRWQLKNHKCLWYVHGIWMNGISLLACQIQVKLDKISLLSGDHRGCSSVVERMLCMYEASGSIPDISIFFYYWTLLQVRLGSWTGRAKGPTLGWVVVLASCDYTSFYSISCYWVTVCCTENEIKSIDPDVIWTRSLLIWSQTRYRCATESLVILRRKIKFKHAASNVLKN